MLLLVTLSQYREDVDALDWLVEEASTPKCCVGSANCRNGGGLRMVVMVPFHCRWHGRAGGKGVSLGGVAALGGREDGIGTNGAV